LIAAARVQRKLRRSGCFSGSADTPSGECCCWDMRWVGAARVEGAPPREGDRRSRFTEWRGGLLWQGQALNCGWGLEVSAVVWLSVVARYNTSREGLGNAAGRVSRWIVCLLVADNWMLDGLHARRRGRKSHAADEAGQRDTCGGRQEPRQAEGRRGDPPPRVNPQPCCCCCWSSSPPGCGS
jgi:hypothetical protein